MLLAVLLAAAAQPSSVGCIADRMGGESVARIGDRVVKAVDAGASPDAAFDADRDALIAARNACRASNKWTSDQTDMAISYLRAAVSLAGAETALRADGFDVGSIRAGYDALGDADRGSMVGGKSPTAAVKAAIDRVASGSKATGPGHLAVVRHVMIYFSARAALEHYPAQFTGG